MNWLLKLIKNLSDALSVRSVNFANDGRSGQVVYTDNRGSIDFYFEFGGGDRLAIVTVPTLADWTVQTGRKSSERAAILDYIGSEIVRRQAPGCNYLITDDAIEVMEPRIFP